MPEFDKTVRNRVSRIPERGKYDTDTIYAIIDEALVCHVGLVTDGRPVVIPTIHARDGNQLLFHGSSASRLLKHLKENHDICVSITLLDGLVLARSVFHHSMNYRSVVLFGKGVIVDDPAQKMRGLEILTDHLIPGRWDEARRPSEKEMKATLLIAMDIDDATAKIRTGPPGDEEEDYSLPVWAGVIPVKLETGEVISDPKNLEGLEVPGNISGFDIERT